jgi:acetate kinase
MLLLFDPNPPELRWCKVENSNYIESSVLFNSEWKKNIAAQIGNLGEVDALGYFLAHGGGEITQPVTRVSASSLTHLENIIQFNPESNEITYQTMQFMMDLYPQLPHLLFCDTAFYRDLPPEASTYAVPLTLRKKKNIQRFGGFGIAHQWAYQQILSLTKSPLQKVVSIYLGNQANITAIYSGKPVDTSIGFTPVEGIVAYTSCGDIDPTIVFYLNSAGMSFNEINNLLSRESGLTALLDKPTLFPEVLRSPDSFAYKVFRYSLLKYLGAYISILSGVDGIVFLSEHVQESLDFMFEICRTLEFLGVERRLTPYQQNNNWILTKSDAPIQVFGLQYNKWEILADQAGVFLNQGG